MGSALADLVTEDALRRHASSRSFARGSAYQEAGAVSAVRWDGKAISGAVDGSDRYLVRLRIDGDGRLDGSCSCPVGRDGAFCKHCVALGLAWLASPRAQVEAALDGGELRCRLVSLGAAPLADLLLEFAAGDGLVEARLLALTAGAGEDRAAFEHLGLAWNAALAPGRMIGWDEAWGFAQGLGRVIDEVERQIAHGGADEAIAFCERAVRDVERAYDRVDDSDGELGGVVERLEEVHLAACEAGGPDPLELAERLFRLELEGEYGAFDGAVKRYADVLGDRGVARFGELVEGAVAALPPATERTGYGRRSTLEGLMVDVRDAIGDVDGIIEVLAQDLTSAWRYEKIAETFHAAGRVDEAVDWAERGVATFPDDPRNLVEFLCDRYLEAGRAEDAVAVALTHLRHAPSAGAYGRLRRVASPRGAWEALRKEARAILRGPAGSGQARSELVRALIAEGAVDDAWVEAAEGGCSRGLMVDLAQLREERHPEDALEICRREIEPAVLRTDRSTYEGAVAWLGRVRAILHRLDRPDEFEHLVFELRENYRPRRNLIKRLDELGWVGVRPTAPPPRPRAKRAA